MANKRSRRGHSQSFTDIALFDQPPPNPFSEVPPDGLSTLQSNNQLLDNQPRQSLFSAPSSAPPPESRGANEGFLERCSTCKKRLDHTKDIHMYNDSSFCTQECRNVQIAIDKAAEDARKRAMDKRTTSNREMNSDSSFCTQECRNVQIAIDKAAEDARKREMDKKMASDREMNR